MATLSSAQMASRGQIWKRVKRLLKPPRRIRFTAHGFWLVTLTLGVGFAALNTGNNLLYFVLGMMLTLIAMSGVMAELSISRMGAWRKFRGDIYAETPTQVTLCVRNKKRLLPAMGVIAKEFKTEDCLAESGFFVVVGPKKEVEQQAQYTFLRRGQHTIPGLYVETKYPFGLFRRGYRGGKETSLLVLPKIESITLEDYDIFSEGGEIEGKRKGDGDAFFGLRHYQEGDDLRRVHWKISARRNRLIIRENTSQTRKFLRVIFNPGSTPEGPLFERGIIRVASLVDGYIKAGFRVDYLGPGAYISPEEGMGQRRRILRALAKLEGPSAPLPVAKAQAFEALGTLKVEFMAQDVVVHVL